MSLQELCDWYERETATLKARAEKAEAECAGLEAENARFVKERDAAVAQTTNRDCQIIALRAERDRLAYAREERDWYEAGREKALARGAAMETALIERSKELERMRAVVAKVRALRSSLATMPFSEPIATVIVRLDEALAEDSA